MKNPYGELEHWLSRFYGDMVEKAGGLYTLGSDEDILQALDFMALKNRQQIELKQRKQSSHGPEAAQA